MDIFPSTAVPIFRLLVSPIAVPRLHAASSASMARQAAHLNSVVYTLVSVATRTLFVTSRLCLARICPVRQIAVPLALLRVAVALPLVALPITRLGTS